VESMFQGSGAGPVETSWPAVLIERNFGAEFTLCNGQTRSFADF
jgi:hypothetical protein